MQGAPTQGAPAVEMGGNRSRQKGISENAAKKAGTVPDPLEKQEKAAKAEAGGKKNRRWSHGTADLSAANDPDWAQDLINIY